jgi:hypothetical protein
MLSRIQEPFYKTEAGLGTGFNQISPDRRPRVRDRVKYVDPQRISDRDTRVRFGAKHPIGREHVTRCNVLSKIVPVGRGGRRSVNPVGFHPQDGNRLLQPSVIAAQKVDRCALDQSELNGREVNFVEDQADFT